MLHMLVFCVFCVFKQKTAYEMRISDWSSDVCSSDLVIFAEELYDADFVTANAIGFDVLKRAVAGFTPDHVSRVVGVPKNQILLAARTFAAAKSGCVVTATGAHFPLHGTLAEYLALCINTVCGPRVRGGQPHSPPHVHSEEQ